MDEPDTNVIQGAPDMPILKTLSLKPLHGFAVEQIARSRSRFAPHCVSAPRTAVLPRSPAN
jgi:hypothetical protein